MAGENEPAKQLLPYLQRADELQKHEPLVAYYCRLYAMERGLKIPQSDRTKTTKDLLVSLMKQLEKDKKSLNLVPDDRFHLEEFALNVFSKGDKQDRAGRADLNTAKTFYAASIFFEIINQFGELPSDLEEKQKYAAWKAADIRKAVKEGRKPVPGPPGGEKDISVPPSEHGGDHDLEQRTDPSSGPGRDMDYQPKLRMNQAMGPSYGTGSLPQVNDAANFQHPADIATSPSNSVASGRNIPPSPSYPSNGYVQDFHQPPASEDTYSHVYHQPTYQQEHHLPMHYPSHDASPYSYPNFQSYPSFTESSLPSVPSHFPSYQMGPDSSYPTSLPSNGVQHASSGEYHSSGRNASLPDVNPSAAKTFQYDSNYMPSPEKITEAHKAARFAVGALAFDDVSTAVDHLRKSLELLTNPSAGQ